jgi:hypothetical protein
MRKVQCRLWEIDTDLFEAIADCLEGGKRPLEKTGSTPFVFWRRRKASCRDSLGVQAAQSILNDRLKIRVLVPSKEKSGKILSGSLIRSKFEGQWPEEAVFSSVVRRAPQ